MEEKVMLKEKIECHFTDKSEKCKAFYFKKCKTIKTKDNCTRVKCCKFEKRGTKISKVNCKFVSPKSCPEIKIQKCHLSITNPNCNREKCCTYSKRGNKLLKLSCVFKGEEKCTETFYIQCHNKKNKIKMYSKKMLYFWKKRKNY